MTTPTIVHCPTCDKDVTWSAESKWKPFCSERCKLIDLGEWFTEGYKLPTQDSGQQPEDDN